MLATLRESLGDGRFMAAWSAGHQLTPEQAVALALAGNISPAEVTDSVPASTMERAPAGLTQRELEVLRCIAEGQTDREIALVLSIGSRTVSSHVTNILNKLNVSSRSAAAAWAARHGVA
jgi:DNA-binding NarL/FixJ family response regulator